MKYSFDMHIQKQIHPGLLLDFDLQLAEGKQILAVLGLSGSGKTSLLRCVSGLTRPDTGRIVVEDKVWFASDQNIHLRPQDRSIGYLNQEPMLFPHYTVRQTLSLFGQGDISQTLSEWKLGHLAEKYPATLSGGEKQQVALLQKILKKPKLFLLDEPFSFMDTPLRRSLRTKLRGYCSGSLVILVTHDVADVEKLADEIAVMDAGRIVQRGAMEELRNKPASETVAKLVEWDSK